MLMAGKAEKYSDLWEADRDHTDAARSYDELLNQVNDNARKRSLGTSMQKSIQHSSDTIAVGAA